MSPSSGRFTVAARSPLTGILGDANSGGHFGPELKYAGFDALMIVGRSEVPCAILIEDGSLSIRDVPRLWGKRVRATEHGMREEMGDEEAHVLSIGPAGEEGVRYAALLNDSHRAAARCGIGAVFGSKRLKAIAVRGTGGVDVSDYDAFMQSIETVYDAIYNDPVYPVLSEQGTPFLMDSAQLDGGLATRNNQSGVCPDYEEISQDRYAELHKVRNFACFSCPIHCSNVSTAVYKGVAGRGEGPEYESLVCLGTKCGITDLPTVITATNRCNELGLDTISCGDSIALAMELWEKGLLTTRDTGGIDLSWGNGESLLTLIEDIAYRRGFGRLLSEGVAAIAAHFGSEAQRYALHVKGMGVPAFDGRAAKGFALGWAVSTRGADHLRALPNFELLGFSSEEAQRRFGSPHANDPYEERGKAELVYWHENFCAVVDSAEMCKYETFSTYAVTPDMLAGLLNAVTGSAHDGASLLAVGERIINVEKLYNIRCAGPQRDTLPYRILHEPLPSGPAKGNTVNLDAMLDAYYRLRGWDHSGVPQREVLKRLGINAGTDPKDGAEE
jgi:aldehyde:ferredoxin oxidoreductase